MIILGLGSYLNRVRYSPKQASWLFVGFFAKLVGALFFVFLYTGYYDYTGDTIFYFQGAQIIWYSLLSDPLAVIDMILLPSYEFALANSDITFGLNYFTPSEEWIFVRIISFLNVFCFNNFICLTILHAVISFIGSWAIFSVFSRRYPRKSGPLFIVIFFIPSCLLWSTGVLKDTLTFGIIGVVFKFINDMISEDTSTWKILLCLIGLYLLFQIKPYLGFIFSGCILLWVAMRYLSITKNPIQRTTLRIAVICIVSIGLIYSGELVQLVQNNRVYKTSLIEIKGYHADSDKQKFLGASSYDLGEIQYTPTGLIKKAPQALSAAMLRPYMWWTQSTQLCILAIENSLLITSLLLCLAWRALVRLRLSKTERLDLFFCLMFTCSVAIIIGITAFNFGLLMRLKTPFLPFFGAAIVILAPLGRKRAVNKYYV